MFDRVKRLYMSGALNLDGVKRAVEFKWITPVEYGLITGELYAE